MRVLSGFVNRITVTVPWTSLMSSSCTVEVSGLSITVSPHLGYSGANSETMNKSAMHNANPIVIRHND